MLAKKSEKAVQLTMKTKGAITEGVAAAAFFLVLWRLLRGLPRKTDQNAKRKRGSRSRLQG